jgi:hypothetical protein
VVRAIFLSARHSKVAARRTIHALHAEEITSCETRRVKALLGIMPLCTIEFTRADIASEVP